MTGLNEEKEREVTRQSRRRREWSDKSNNSLQLIEPVIDWMLSGKSEGDCLCRAFPSTAWSVLAIKACARWLWFKHQNEVETREAELWQQWRLKGGKCAGHCSSTWASHSKIEQAVGALQVGDDQDLFRLTHAHWAPRESTDVYVLEPSLSASVVLNWASRFSLCLQLTCHVTSVWLFPSVHEVSVLLSDQF